MKNLAVILIIFYSLYSVNSNAQEEQTFYPNWYGSFHLAQADTSLNSGGQDFNYFNVGGAVGYRFSEYLSTEFFMSFATNDKRDDLVSDFIGENVGTRFDAVGVYLVAQTQGEFYAKGRVGLTQSRFTYSVSGFEDESKGSVGLSYGIGVGTKVENYTFDLEYIVMPEADDPLFSEDSYDTDIIAVSMSIDF